MIAFAVQQENICLPSPGDYWNRKRYSLSQVNVAIVPSLPRVQRRSDPTLRIHGSSFARMIKTSSMKSRLKWTSRYSSERVSERMWKM